MTIRVGTDRHGRQTLARLGLLTAAIVFAVDQATKLLLEPLLQATPSYSVGVIPGFLDFTLAYNRGISFGLFKADDTAGWLTLVGLAGGVSLLLVWLILRAENRWLAVGYGLVLGGAVGNLLDRLRVGAVVDFIDVHLGSFRFWTFNVADGAITFGVICLLIDMVVREKKDG